MRINRKIRNIPRTCFGIENNRFCIKEFCGKFGIVLDDDLKTLLLQLICIAIYCMKWTMRITFIIQDQLKLAEVAIANLLCNKIAALLERSIDLG